jgi:hypothetical protein
LSIHIKQSARISFRGSEWKLAAVEVEKRALPAGMAHLRSQPHQAYERDAYRGISLEL